MRAAADFFKRLFRGFREGFREGLLTSSPTASPTAAPTFSLLSPRWTTVDRDNWARFLAGETGKKLIARCRAFEAANAIAGCKDVFHTSHSAGKAVGYGELLDHQLSLSLTRSVNREQNSIGAPGEAPANESPAQTEAREYAELLARFSP